MTKGGVFEVLAWELFMYLRCCFCSGCHLMYVAAAATAVVYCIAGAGPQGSIDRLHTPFWTRGGGERQFLLFVILFVPLSVPLSVPLFVLLFVTTFSF
jgi:hypothetical protein